MAVHVRDKNLDLRLFERQRAQASEVNSALVALAVEWLASMDLQVYEDVQAIKRTPTLAIVC